MKYNDTIQLFKTVINAINDPSTITHTPSLTEIFQFPNGTQSNSSIYTEDKNYTESDSNEYKENVTVDGDNLYKNNNKKKKNKRKNKKNSISNSDSNSNNGYYYNEQDTSSNPQGVIDCITQELTSVRLQQAIILSEIVGKPKSKTRKRRRF
jgi:hypothetical protein